jgi:hypothetical protein
MRPSASTFESVGHFKHCFFGSADLGQCEGMWVAPSGNLAIWQEAPSEKVLALRTSWKSPSVIIPEPPGLIESVEWGDPANTVHLNVYQRYGALEAKIPEN